jgi:hypothetical protein
MVALWPIRFLALGAKPNKTWSLSGFRAARHNSFTLAQIAGLEHAHSRPVVYNDEIVT